MAVCSINKIEKKEYNLILNAKTDRQEGDIAGTKLLKFYNFIKSELEKQFYIDDVFMFHTHVFLASEKGTGSGNRKGDHPW